MTTLHSGRGSAGDQPSFDHARDQLGVRLLGAVPLGIRQTRLEAEGGPLTALPLRFPIAGEVSYGVVLGSGSAAAPVSADLITSWGVDHEEVHAAAFRSSRARVAGARVSGRPFRGVHRVDHPEVAVWALTVPGRAAQLRIHGSPVALPVTADTLFVTGSTDRAGLEWVAASAEAMLDAGQALLTTQPLVWEGERWQPFPWPQSVPRRFGRRALTPPEVPGERLTRRFLAAAYCEQRPILTRLPMDVPVVQVHQVDGGTRLRAEVTEGVATVLPAVDEVVLTRGDGDREVLPLPQFVAGLGDRAHQLPVVPALWRLDGAPPTPDDPLQSLAAVVLTEEARSVFDAATQLLDEQGRTALRARYPDLDNHLPDGPRPVGMLLAAGQAPYPVTIGWCDEDGEDEPGQVRHFVEQSAAVRGLPAPALDEETEERVIGRLGPEVRRGEHLPALVRDIDDQLRHVGQRLLLIRRMADTWWFAPVTQADFERLDGLTGPDGPERYRLSGVD